MDIMYLILRGAVIGAGVLFMCVLLIERPREQITIATCGLNLAIICENLMTLVDPSLMGLHYLFGIGRSVLPLFFAWFVMAVFTDSPISMRSGSVPCRYLLGVALLAIPFGLVPPQYGFYSISHTICQILAITTFIGTVGLVLATARDDLVNRRRKARTAFVVALGVAGVSFTAMNFFPGLEPFEIEIGIFKSIIIFGLIAMSAAFILQPGGDFVPDPSQTTQPHHEDGEMFDWVIAKIEHVMSDGIWSEEGLTISELADRVGAPEYLVRRTINQRMGFRNFPTFVNSYRVRAAQDLLADPDQARKSVLEIAFEVGFASLGPFNKAFKDFSETTPTEFRRQAFAHNSLISEKLH